MYHRIIKQTLQSSGANVTKSHIIDVSLAAMFLLEASKKADREFGVKVASQRHTMRDASLDISKIAKYLKDKAVTSEMQGRETPKFIHPTEKGWEKMSDPNWLTTVLSTSVENEVG